MAQIDFSNAEINAISNEYPMNYYYLAIRHAATLAIRILDATRTVVLSAPTGTILTDTPTKYSIAYTGVLDFSQAAGVSIDTTKFLLQAITSGTTDHICWEITNINFSD